MFNFPNIFGNSATPAQPAAPATPATPAQPGNLQDPAILDAQSTVPETTAPVLDPNSTDLSNTPLEAYDNLWETNPTANTKAPVSVAPLNETELREVIAKQDFSNMITAETLAGIPEEQHAATIAAMNTVAQNVMTQATLVNNKLNAQNLEAAEKRFNEQLPDILRQQAVTNHTKETSPLLTNPAIKPVAEAAQAQLLAKFPEASQAQIIQMTENYIKQMGEAFAPAPVTSPAELEQDFSKFLD